VNAHFQPALNFDAAAEAAGDAILVVDIDGFEGPLHTLLALARAQKVDLLKLSITRLADQYLAFVREARRRHFTLAADYLVMAAWLAYLKSRLLLPKTERAVEEPAAPEVLAERLAFRLAKLDAMRRAAETLGERAILRRDVFCRGDPEAQVVVSRHALEGDLHGLLAAYLRPRLQSAERTYRPMPVEAYPLDEARARLRTLAPALTAWTALADLAPPTTEAGATRASCIASTLSASLELVREGELDARQTAPFSDIFLRATLT